MIIIITGGAGFIGSALVRYLNDLGKKDLLLVDDLESTDKWKNLVGKEFLDIIQKNKLHNYIVNNVRRIGSIIHLGACANTLERNADYLMENNFHYSISLAEIAVREGIRFIYASSAATYGKGEQGFDDDEVLLEKLRPTNIYAFSKHLFDLWAKKNGLFSKIVGLKYFNVFGPNEYHKGNMASMILKMMQRISRGEKIKLFKSNDNKIADGEQKRDFIYVKDAVKMTASFLNNKLTGIFNIGTGETITWNALTEAFFDAINKKTAIEYIDMPSEIMKQYQNFTCANMNKFAQNFPQFKCMSIREAVKDYVQNYLVTNTIW